MDFVEADKRLNIVSNRVVLRTPEGNTAGITSLEDADTDKVSVIALGKSDVTVGQ